MQKLFNNKKPGIFFAHIILVFFFNLSSATNQKFSESSDFKTKKSISKKKINKALTIASASTFGFGGSYFLGSKLFNKNGNKKTAEENKVKLPDSSTYIENAKNMFEIYENGYSPPKISLDWMSNPALAGDVSFQNSAEKTTVYVVDKEERADLVMRLLTEREPVNIGMSRSYHFRKLFDHFGYSFSAYSQLGRSDFLPTNLAVYCYTPIWTKTNWHSSLGDFFGFVHVINVIGFAFDSFDQVDYKYFKNQTRNVLLESVHNMIIKSFQCAIDKKFQRFLLLE